MSEFFKQLFNSIVSDYIKEWLDNKAISSFVFSICASLGCYMLTQQILGSIILVLSLVYLAYKCNQNYSIKNKLLIVKVNFIPIRFVKEQKLAIKIQYFIYNFSLHQIYAEIDRSNTSYKIKIISNNDQTIYTEEEVSYPTLVPFVPFMQDRSVSTNDIIIPITDNMKIKISSTLCLKYGIKQNKLIYTTLHKLDNTFSIENIDKPDIKILPASLID